MLINTNVASSLTTGGTTNYIAAGIQDNVILKSCRIAKSPNNNRYLELTFEQDGKTLVQTEWEPSRFGNMSEEDFKKRLDSHIARIDLILRQYYPNESDREIVTDSYDEYLKWVDEKLATADLSTKLRVKFVYNDKGYLALPKYLKIPYIERMDVEKSEISIREIDRLVRPVIEDQIPAQENPFGEIAQTPSPTAAPVRDNELPF